MRDMNYGIIGTSRREYYIYVSWIWRTVSNPDKGHNSCTTHKKKNGFQPTFLFHEGKQAYVIIMSVSARKLPTYFGAITRSLWTFL
jgi:hypothetical protein